MSDLTSITTPGNTTFADCGELKHNLKVLRVNAGVPLREALEHASHLLYYSTRLSLEGAMDAKGEHYTFAAHYLCEMGKAIVDDIFQALPDPQ